MRPQSKELIKTKGPACIRCVHGCAGTERFAAAPAFCNPENTRCELSRAPKYTLPSSKVSGATIHEMIRHFGSQHALVEVDSHCTHTAAEPVKYGDSLEKSWLVKK